MDAAKKARLKLSQNDLRRLMTEQKAKAQKTKTEEKVNSPLASYDSSGRLKCIICNSIVKSANIWKVHVNSKQHKSLVESTKQLKDKLLEKSIPSTITADAQTKLRTANGTQKIAKTPETVTIDNKTNQTQQPPPQPPTQQQQQQQQQQSDEQLPENFFDKPKKVQKIEQDDEWERFQRAIKEETALVNEIIAVEHDETSINRQIEELDEQIERWSKVKNLEAKKELIKRNTKPTSHEREKSETESSSSDEDEKNYEDFPNWRSKSFAK